jgi:uncharacterized damage-inducible protein DinB
VAADSHERFAETLTAFGQYPSVVHDLLLYVIDNEIHHRWRRGGSHL